jgi:DUF4097 and DUF4098 domain-containing protein YvlB
MNGTFSGRVPFWLMTGEDHQMKKLGRLCGLALAFLVITVPARADVWSKVYLLTGLPDLRLDTNDGHIKVVSADVKEIKVNLTAEGWQIGNDVKITETQNGNNVDLQIRVPQQLSWHFFNIGRKALFVEVRVPRNANMDLHTGDGDVILQDVSGRIRVDTGDGRITSQGLNGEIRMHTGDGRIEGTGLNGTLDADTGDGSIFVVGRFAALQLKSGDGNIEVAAEAGSRSSDGWSIYTGDGKIRLRLPQDFGAELDARTGDGRVTVDFPVTSSGSLDSSHMKGKLGSGGGMLQIRTGDGSIYLERR